MNSSIRRPSPATDTTRVIALFTTVVLLGGGSGSCGGSSAPSMESCPNDVPASCTTSSPSYATDVAPVLAARCGACHTVGGIEAVHPFDTHAEVRAQSVRILSQVHACLMPPADQTPMSAEERLLLFSWIVCGAADN